MSSQSGHMYLGPLVPGLMGYKQRYRLKQIISQW